MTSLSWQSLFDYLIRVGDALSQLVNVAVLLGENPNESISGRAFRRQRYSLPWRIVYNTVNFLFFNQFNHCRHAYLQDLHRARATIQRHETVWYDVELPNGDKEE